MTPIEHPQKIGIIDTTLRDGLQNPEMPEHGKYSLTIPERVDIFTALVQYGVPEVEVFSPTVNAAEKESLAAILEARDGLVAEYGYTKILAHVRCDESDVRAALEAGVDGLNMYMGTSQQSRAFNHGKDLRQIALRARPLLEQIRRDYPEIQLRFSGEDAFRTELDDLKFVYDYIATAVDRFGMPDTVGVAKPKGVYDRVKAIKTRYPHAKVEGHFHNDRGFALPNSLAAIEAGMDYIDTSVLGLAERSGITSLTGLLFNLYLDQRELTAGFHLEDSYALNVLVANIMGMQVPYTEPVSLTNNTHSAGVHTGAMLRNESAYKAHPLEAFGLSTARLLLGPLSGWHAVDYYLTHILKYEQVTEPLAREITTIFKDKYSHGSQQRDPTDVLEEIAAEFALTRMERPHTHEEIFIEG